MALQCSICSHPKREEIDRAILSGEPVRAVARQFGVSRSALNRHKNNGHLSKAIARATAKEAGLVVSDGAPTPGPQEIRAAREVAVGGALIEQMRDLLATARRLLTSAETQDDLRAAAPLLGQVRQTLETIGKITGEIPRDGGATVNVNLIEQQNNQFQTIVLEVMCPECRERVAARLREVLG